MLDDVLGRNIVNVLFHVGLERPRRQRAVTVSAVAREHAVVVFQRKFRVDRHFAGGLWQHQHTIRATAVGQRGLETVGIRRQDIAYQPFQLDLAKCPARALVAEQFLQGQHVARQAVDFLLRLVDGGESRHYVGKGFVGLFEALIKTFGDLAGNLRQPRIHALGQRIDRTGQL